MAAESASIHAMSPLRDDGTGKGDVRREVKVKEKVVGEGIEAIEWRCTIRAV